MAGQNGAAGLVHSIQICAHQPRNQRLAEAKAGIYRTGVAVFRNWVSGEQNAGNIGHDHTLHHGGKGDEVVREAVLNTVENRAVSKQRDEAVFDLGEDIGLANNIEVGVLRPAKDALGRSSAVAEECTAKANGGTEDCQLMVMSCANAVGSSCAAIRCRTLAPAARILPRWSGQAPRTVVVWPKRAITALMTSGTICIGSPLSGRTIRMPSRATPARAGRGPNSH